jgi:MarR family transcriptional regulator, organic hydroperoxide resistance regulator
MPAIKRKSTVHALEQVELGTLGGLLGFHIRMAQDAMYRHFNGALEPVDLRQREFAVLELIRVNAGISQVELATALHLDRPPMMIVIDRLEDRGLVARTRSKRDRRRQDLHLTPAGRELLVEARGLVKEHDRVFTSLFAKTDAAILIDQLREISRHIQELAPVPSHAEGE